MLDHKLAAPQTRMAVPHVFKQVLRARIAAGSFWAANRAARESSVVDFLRHELQCPMGFGGPEAICKHQTKSDEPPIERVNRRSAIESTIGASSARLSLAKLRPRRASLRFTEQPQSSKSREQNDSSGQTANMAESTSDSEHEMAAAPVIQPSLLTNVRPHSSHAFRRTSSEVRK